MTEHILGHNTSLNKFKTEIISSIFSYQNGVILEIKYRKKNWIKHKYMKIK